MVTGEMKAFDNWKTGQPTSKGRFEVDARKFRYQALAGACLHAGITNLLVAHHADDQVETVLLRMIKGSTAVGLAGMKPMARIPECEEIFNADQIKIIRPLLGVRKVGL